MKEVLLVLASLFAPTQAFSQAAFPPPPIDTMMRKNPARLLGLT
ncbi:MAG TPA: hypothetical protein VFR30_03645 [Lysobacter sp.]|nr:hypothetical protein [Lysobacter sp.]